MYRNILNVFFILLLVKSLSAQFNFVPINIDYATFHTGNGNSYIEIYISVSQDDLTYQRKDSSLVTHFGKTVKIIKQDSVIGHITRNYKNSKNDKIDRNTHNQFIDVFPFELEPGHYEVHASITDYVAQKTGEITFTTDIVNYGKDLSISMLELATMVRPTEEYSNFSLKNKIEIYPHPSRSFSVFWPVMYFYFEAYNLSLDTSGNNSYTVHYFITDLERSLVRDFSQKVKSTDTTTIAEASGMNIMALPSGKYILSIELRDNFSGDSVSVYKDFAVFKSSQNISQLPSSDNLTDYLTMDMAELKAEFERAKYIATSEEKDTFEKLDVDGMRRFLATFWKNRDPEPTTAINELRQTYLENIALANTLYSMSFKEGWRTDRGRVLLIYGKPDEIERNPSSIDSKPFEKWHYYSLEGGVEFIFGDVTGLGDYELIHSTHRNEIHDTNWWKRVGQASDLLDY